MKFEISSHAGELEEETLDEVWDHLQELNLPVPDISDSVISFFATINGVVPLACYVNGLRVSRFLNFCNDYLAENIEIAEWHIVRNRRWIADRLDPYVIPIAEFAHGDYLCLDFSKIDSVSAVKWNHEQSSPGKPEYELVATDLESLMTILNSNQS